MLLNSLLVSATLIAVSPSTTPATASVDLHPVEQNILRDTNLQRQRLGLPPLTIDSRLMSSARRHCAWMARSGSLVHTTAAVAENIAMGQSRSQEAVRDWMNSPGHRANMVGHYTRIGVSAYTGANGMVFWCVQFLR